MPISDGRSLKWSSIHVHDSAETSVVPFTCAAEEANLEMRTSRSPLPNISVSGMSAIA